MLTASQLHHPEESKSGKIGDDILYKCRVDLKEDTTHKSTENAVICEEENEVDSDKLSLDFFNHSDSSLSEPNSPTHEEAKPPKVEVSLHHMTKREVESPPTTSEKSFFFTQTLS